MLDEEGKLWVVKFQNNPQGVRVLANEWIAGRLAEALGLPVPEMELVDVPERLVTDLPDMHIELPRGGRKEYASGQHFGSAFQGSLFPGRSVDYLPDERLRRVRNLRDFAGMLAFDKWTGNCDARQAVYARSGRETNYRATFIDQGFCFNAGEWNFPDRYLRGTHVNLAVYVGVKGWESFEPWLSRIEAMDWMTLSKIADSVPQLWYGDDRAALNALMEQLMSRRGRVRELIAAYRECERIPFPNWAPHSY